MTMIGMTMIATCPHEVHKADLESGEYAAGPYQYACADGKRRGDCGDNLGSKVDASSVCLIIRLAHVRGLGVWVILVIPYTEAAHGQR